MAKTTGSKEAGRGAAHGAGHSMAHGAGHSMAHGAARGAARGGHGKGGPKGKGTLKSPAQARLDRRANDDRVIKTIRMVFVAIVVLAVIGVAAGIFLFMYKPPVATVGGLPVQQYEFAYFMKTASQYYEGSSVEEMRANALQEAAGIKMRLAKAKELGIALTDEDTANRDSTINEIIPYYAEMTGVTSNQYILDNFGITLAQYSTILDDMLLNDRLTQVLMDDVEVSDEDAMAVYEASPEHYNEATVRHILFTYEGLDEEEPRTKEASELMAQETLRRIIDGDDISSLAVTLTEDTASANTGGEYTFRQDEGYAPEFLDWAFSHEVGDKGIVETEFGYHVMQLDARRSAFEDFKDEIVEELKLDAVEQQYDEWIEDPRYEVVPNQKVIDTFT